MKTYFKILIGVIISWYAFVLALPKLPDESVRATTAKVKSSLTSFVNARQPGDAFDNVTFNDLQSQVHLGGKGYALKTDGEILVAEPLEKSYYRKAFIQRIIWLNWKKKYNPIFVIDLGKNSLELKPVKG